MNIGSIAVMVMAIALAAPASARVNPTPNNPAPSPSANQGQHHPGQGQHHAGHSAPHTPGPSWTQFPLLVSSGGGRMQRWIQPRQITSTTLDLFSSLHGREDGDQNQAYRQLSMEPKGFLVTPEKGVGGYHWVQTTQQEAGVIRSASSMVYFSMPSPSPKVMLAQKKQRLEIIPDPMPREHGHYRAGESWPFQIRFAGQPLPQAELVLETEQGERLTFQSDADGMAMVTFPAQFKEKPKEEAGAGQSHRHGRRPQAEFVLAVSHQEGDQRYLTAFNHHYRPGPFFQKSLLTGLGFFVFGMALATPLLSRKTKKGGGA
ncbi:MAG: hypothetical protein HQL52_00280 [Magnetococcales bacterium]|nr:hypothetical protein [Magnetococcales bacterium]